MRIAVLVIITCLLAGADVPIPAKGEASFTVALPDGWSAVAAADGATTLLPPQKRPHIQVWAVVGKRTVDEASADIAAILVPQVKDFATAQRTDLTIAGAKAQLLVGTGTEADDGDPSHAQATVFAVGGRVWVLVSHGEGEGASERAADIAAVLKTVSAVPRP